MSMSSTKMTLGRRFAAKSAENVVSKDNVLHALPIWSMTSLLDICVSGAIVYNSVPAAAAHALTNVALPMPSAPTSHTMHALFHVV